MRVLTGVGVDRDELVAALRRGVAGFGPRMAVVELLASHGHWLGRDPFLVCLRYYPADQQGPAVALTNWTAVGVLLDYAQDGAGLPDTDAQRCVLGVAASLAGGYRVDLRDLVFCDQPTVELIGTAIQAAGGGQ